MANSGQYLEVRAGTTRPITIDIKQADGEPANLAGLAGTDLKFDLSQGGEIKLSKDLTSGVVITDAANGKATIIMAAADTEQLSGRYSWLVMMTTTDEEVYDVADGSLVVLGAEPVTLSEAKRRMHVDEDLSDDDGMISELIVASRDLAERFTNTSIALQSRTAWFDASDLIRGSVELPQPPIVEIISVTAFDGNDDGAALDADQYRLEDGRIVFAEDADLGTLRAEDALKVTFLAGYEAPDLVPLGLKHGIMGIIADAYDCGGGVRLEAARKYLQQYRRWNL